MNNSLKTIILWIFVILLSVSLFVYFGDTSTSFTPGTQTLGMVNGFPIINKRISEFAENYRSLQDTYQSQGLDVTEYQQVLVGEAFRRAVIGHLAKEQAEKAKIVVSDSDVIDSIKENYFEGNIEDFHSFTQEGDASTQRDLEALVRGRFIKNYYEDTLREVPFTKSQLENRIKLASLQRSALVAFMSVSTQVEKGINSEILQTYYQNNISRYSFNTNSNFEDIIDDIRSDYLLENRESIIANIQNTITFQFQNFSSNQLTEGAFWDLAAANDMFVIETAYFNFFSQAITAKRGGGQSIINDRPTIRKLFFIPMHTVSEVISQEDFLGVVYINKEIVDNEVSDFVKRRYSEELQQELLRQLFTAYYSSLYRDAQIEVNQQLESQPQ